MAQKHSLKAERRARTGSGLLKQMRREGWLPSVLYGADTENENLKVSERRFRELMAESASENILLNLEVEGEKKRLAYLQAIQHDPLSGAALHADFLAVSEKTSISASVPIILNGEPKGVESGGILEQMLQTLEITCPASKLPESFEFDVSELDQGDSLSVGDVTLPDGVVSSYDDEVQIAHISLPTPEPAEDEEVEAAEGEEEAGEEGESDEEEADAETAES